MTDEQLAERAAAGDGEAFTGLYERYKQVLFNFAWRVVGETGLAEDAAQEALISAFRHINSFDPARGSFRAWILTIVHNESRHIVSVRKWRQFALGSSVTVSLEEISALDERISTDGMLDLEKALRRLPAKLRVPLILTKLQGLSARECAGVLGISEVNVKQRVFRAMHRLRDRIDAEKRS